MPAQKAPAGQTIYQLKVTLRGSKPPIWRRLQVRSDITLAKLHQILQVAMGWTDSHMHQFIVGGTYYGVPSKELDLDVKSERTAKLDRIAPAEKSHFGYEYDFGDDWIHEVLVEKILPPAEGVHYPVCITGKRAGPPEDCGGIWGYEELLAAIRDPQNPEHEEMLEWVGDDFDPEAFDLDAVNAELRQLR